MIKLDLKTSNKAQEQIKQYLEENASEMLADKINNGVNITKDNKTLLNKKDLDGFWKFATDEARKQAEKGASGAYVVNETVYGWAIHYFEEDSIEGKLYNEDGSEYTPTPKIAPKTTKVETPKPMPKIEEKDKQTTLFDLLTESTDTTQEQPKIETRIEQVNNEIIDYETGEVLQTETKSENELYTNLLKVFNNHIKIKE